MKSPSREVSSVGPKNGDSGCQADNGAGFLSKRSSGRPGLGEGVGRRRLPSGQRGWVQVGCSQQEAGLPEGKLRGGRLKLETRLVCVKELGVEGLWQERCEGEPHRKAAWTPTVLLTAVIWADYSALWPGGPLVWNRDSIILRVRGKAK